MPLAHHIIASPLLWRSLTLIPIGILGGPLGAFAVGAVSSTGFYNPVLVYIAFTCGDILTDSLYYYLGRGARVQSLVHRYGKKFGITAEHFLALHVEWTERTFRTMLISKYGMALTPPMLISSGIARLSPRRFYLYAVSISVVQYGIFVPLGFYFARLFTIVSDAFRAIQIAAIIIIFAYGFEVSRRFARKALGRTAHQHARVAEEKQIARRS